MAYPEGEREEVFWRSRGWWGRTGQTAMGVWGAGLLSIATTVIAARALGPEAYGSVFLALSVVTAVSIFLDITLEEATVYYGNRSIAVGDAPGVRALLARSLRVDIGVGLVVSAAIFALAEPLAEVASAGRVDPDLIRILALSALVTTADSTGYAALALAHRVDLRARGVAATSAFRLIGVGVAVQVGGAEAVAVSYVIGGAAGSAVLAVLAWRHGWRRWDPGEARAPCPVSAWELMRFGFHSSVTTSVQAISGTLVPVLLARAAGPAAVGIYRIARLPIVVSNMLSGPVRLAMFPEQAKLVAEGRVEDVRRSTRAYTLIGFGLGSLGAVVGWFALPYVIPFLYSSSFEGAVTPARILLIAAVCNFALLWRKSLLGAIGRPEVRTHLAIIQVVVTVGLMLLLADQGAEGAAIATSAGIVAAGLVWLILARSLLNEDQMLKSAAQRRPPPAEAIGAESASPAR
jgi:O-antigen/teichoic acid export membrane protein